MANEPGQEEPEDAASERDGRRLEPVGLAMATVLVALAIAVVMNARGTAKNASIQPDSPARDVAVFITARIADVSGALGLTEPRRLIASAVGQGDKDDIVTNVGSAPARKAPATATPVRQTFSPQRKLRLYAGGDSLSLETAAALAANSPKTGVIDMTEPDGHLNTGLLRPDSFNWFDRTKEVEAGFRPDASVLIFGGNDNDGYMTGGPNGSFYADFGSPAWEREYRRRTGLLMDTLTQRPGQVLFWVGAPVAQDAQLDAQMKVLNRIYSSEAAKRKGSVIYVDPDPIFAPNGQYQTSITHKGSQVVVREPDGQHLNTEGGVVLADVLLDLMKKTFSFRGAAAAQPTAAPPG